MPISDTKFISTSYGSGRHPSCNLPLGEFAARLATYLRGLSSLSPKLAGWAFQGAKPQLQGAPILPDGSNLYGLISENQFKDADRHYYRHLAPDGRFAPGSVVDVIGISASAVATGGDAAASEDRSSAGASASSLGDARFGFCGSYYQEFAEPPMMRRALDLTLEVWQPQRLEISANELRTAAFTSQFRSYHAVLAGWFNYLRCPGLERHLPPDIEWEALPDGGLLVFSNRSSPDSKNSEDLARVRRLQSVLDDLWLTQHPFLHDGWPRDDIEDDYARQITGAPPGRAYRVSLANFSGYDAARKVLLWTRTFRNDKPETFRYLPTFVKPVVHMREVAEARHQLRSLELAGASNPIEWHIARADLVTPLQALLHQHGGIPEERLRIVHTPHLDQRQ